jgi:hypothetical protein
VLENTLVEKREDGAGPSPDHFTDAERLGRLVPDQHPDEHATCYIVQGRGLVVISSCGHVGLINTIKAAMAVSGVGKLHAVLGGFHLSRRRRITSITRSSSSRGCRLTWWSRCIAAAPSFLRPCIGRCPTAWSPPTSAAVLRLAFVCRAVDRFIAPIHSDGSMSPPVNPRGPAVADLLVFSADRGYRGRDLQSPGFRFSMPAPARGAAPPYAHGSWRNHLQHGVGSRLLL